MRFSKSALALLALITSAASQVIVTATQTVTVNPPTPTSTDIIYVTINAPPTSTQWTSTQYVNITAMTQQPAPSGDCSKLVPDKGQCGGLNYNGCTKCEGWHQCYSINKSYSQCQGPHSYRITTIVSTIIIDKNEKK